MVYKIKIKPLQNYRKKIKNEEFRKLCFKNINTPVTFIGDSIISNIFSIQKYRALWNLAVPKNTLNLGISGDTIENMWARSIDCGLPRYTKLVIIHIGTNNLKGWNDDTIIEGITDMLTSLSRKYQNTTFIFSSLLRRFDDKGSLGKKLNERIIDINSHIKEAVKNKNRIFYHENKSMSINDLFQDNLHLGDSGVKKFLDSFQYLFKGNNLLIPKNNYSQSVNVNSSTSELARVIDYNHPVFQPSDSFSSSSTLSITDSADQSYSSSFDYSFSDCDNSVDLVTLDFEPVDMPEFFSDDTLKSPCSVSTDELKIKIISSDSFELSQSSSYHPETDSIECITKCKCKSKVKSKKKKCNCKIPQGKKKKNLKNIHRKKASNSYILKKPDGPFTHEPIYLPYEHTTRMDGVRQFDRRLAEFDVIIKDKTLSEVKLIISLASSAAP